MPLIGPEYIATWYYFLSQDGLMRIFERWSERQRANPVPKKLLAGDIGTRVMDVPGQVWETSITSPLLIVENAAGAQVEGVFDILRESFAFIQDPAQQQAVALEQQALDPNGNAEGSVPYLLKSAEINIGQEGVVVTLSFVSAIGGAFYPEFGPDLPPNFLARTARFYDMRFNVTEDLGAFSYSIKKGSIKIAVDIEENYFMNTDQRPYFAIQGYHVNGDLEVVASPQDYELIIQTQNPGDFTVVGSATTQLQIRNAVNAQLDAAGTLIDLGAANLNSYVERSLSPGEITTIKIGFEHFVNYSTYLANNPQ